MPKKEKRRAIAMAGTSFITPPATLHESMPGEHPPVATAGTSFIAPPATMHDNDCTLWCLIEGESTPFKVTAPIDKDVADLKKLIRAEGERGSLGHVDA